MLRFFRPLVDKSGRRLPNAKQLVLTFDLCSCLLQSLMACEEKASENIRSNVGGAEGAETPFRDFFRAEKSEMGTRGPGSTLMQVPESTTSSQSP